MTEIKQIGPIKLELVAYKCYDTYIQYKGAAGAPDLSFYLPRQDLPGDSYPYRIYLTLESPPDTHWKDFSPDTFI